MAFSAHPSKKFLAVLARVLDGLVSQVCSHTASYNDALDLWQSLHAFLDRLDALSELDKEVTLHIQDLAGFFVGIPLPRFLQAVKLLLCKACDLQERDLCEGLHGVYVTVDMTNTTAPMRLFRGRYCSPAPKVCSIRMDLFMMAVELSFKFSPFTVGRQVLQQSRGAPMGSPFSHSVCHAVISLFEHQYFLRMLLSPIQTSSHRWVGRYVANRLTLLSPMLSKLPVFAAFLHEEVYGPPVLLEYEDGDVFLGFYVGLARMEIRFVQPQASWQFLHHKSACSHGTLLSSLRSRAHMSVRSPWPATRRDADLRLLHGCYVRQGFCSLKVEKLLRRICVYRPDRHRSNSV